MRALNKNVAAGQIAIQFQVSQGAGRHSPATIFHSGLYLGAPTPSLVSFPVGTGPLRKMPTPLGREAKVLDPQQPELVQRGAVLGGGFEQCLVEAAQPRFAFALDQGREELVQVQPGRAFALEAGAVGAVGMAIVCLL